MEIRTDTNYTLGIIIITKVSVQGTKSLYDGNYETTKANGTKGILLNVK